MIIFGIDPGTATTGYGVIEVAGSARFHVAHGVIRTPQGMPASQRLMMLRDALDGLFRRYNPGLLGVEQLFFSSNVKSAMQVAEARGVILLTAADRGIDVVEFTPNRVKQSVTQNGRAEKKDVQAMIRLLLSLAETPRPDDAADALAIAICASQEPRWAPVARKMLQR